MVNHINIKILENDTNIKKMSTQYTMDAKNLKKIGFISTTLIRIEYVIFASFSEKFTTK